MLERAQSYMPELAQISGLRVWTGFRAATPDKLPLIGPAEGLSDDRTLWLAVGFEGLGITNAPAAARLLDRSDARSYLGDRCDSLLATAHDDTGGHACLKA